MTNPLVAQAVQEMTFAFCRETLATSQLRADEAYEQLQQDLAEGLDLGEALANLTKRVQAIFASPQRALMIAATESSRAQHAGQLLAARDSGVVDGLAWLASSDCCDRCAELDGKEVQLGEPFVVLPGGGPYAVVGHPPLHPLCMCSCTEVL